MLENQLSEKRSPVTEQGYIVILKVFTQFIWFECHSTMLTFNAATGPAKNEYLLSRLSLHVSTYQECSQVIRGWGQAYGRDFACSAIALFNEFHQNLNNNVEKLLPPLPSNSSLGPGMVN